MGSCTKSCKPWLSSARQLGRSRTQLWLLLTLTVRNCSGADLSATLDTIAKGWDRLCKTQRYKRAVRGTMRAVEITYNRSTGQYHPHMHVLCAVLPSYYTSRDYIRQAQWSDMWRDAARLDYNPVVDVRPPPPARPAAWRRSPSMPPSRPTTSTPPTSTQWRMWSARYTGSVPAADLRPGLGFCAICTTHCIWMMWTAATLYMSAPWTARAPPVLPSGPGIGTPGLNYILGCPLWVSSPTYHQLCSCTRKSDYVRSADIDGAAAILGNPCAGCPAENAIANAGPDDSPPCCYSCPLWGLRVDLAQLRLLRRLELGGI